MNTVILLNPNQNVKIKNTVKEILKKINLENFYFLPEKPVLIDISHFYSEEKNLKEEIQKIVSKIIEEVGATSMKDMGKVMAALMPLTKGKADGKRVNLSVKKFLS